MLVIQSPSPEVALSQIAYVLLPASIMLCGPRVGFFISHVLGSIADGVMRVGADGQTVSRFLDA